MRSYFQKERKEKGKKRPKDSAKLKERRAEVQGRQGPSLSDGGEFREIGMREVKRWGSRNDRRKGNPPPPPATRHE